MPRQTSSDPGPAGELPGAIRAARPADAAQLRSMLDDACKSIRVDAILLLTLLPRGGFQLAQPARLPDGLARSYGKELHKFDRLAWQAVIRDRAVRLEELWPNSSDEPNPFFDGLMFPHGFRHAVALPLEPPFLPGYPGVLEVFRTDDLGPFDSEDLRRLEGLAADVRAAVANVRGARENRRTRKSQALRMQPAMRVFVFTAASKPILGQASFEGLDATLKANIIDLVRRRLAHARQPDGDVASDRVSLPDATGDLWNFRATTHSAYPALGEGPFVILALQPDCDDFSLLRGGDFAADDELARLIPALKFMQENFRQGPTLHEIARVVGLSPFHFHRRFTELLGITPKHFLLDCQILHAKEALLTRRQELVEIARACGFAHQSHFTSRFKQATGLTPTRWRRLVGKIGQSAPAEQSRSGREQPL